MGNKNKNMTKIPMLVENDFNSLIKEMGNGGGNIILLRAKDVKTGEYCTLIAKASFDGGVLSAKPIARMLWESEGDDPYSDYVIEGGRG